MRLIVLLASLLTAIPVLAGNEQSLLDFELKSLAEPEKHSLEQYAGTPTVMMFFEPDCGWCFRQIKVLNKLSQQCSGEFNLVAVGVNGSRSELLKEYRRAKPRFPAYQASNKLLQAIGGVEATPFTILADAKGQPLSWFRGYLAEQKLLTHLHAHIQTGCFANS